LLFDKIDEVLRKISDIIISQIEPNPQDEISPERKQAENISISDTTIRPRKGQEKTFSYLIMIVSMKQF